MLGAEAIVGIPARQAHVGAIAKSDEPAGADREGRALRGLALRSELAPFGKDGVMVIVSHEWPAGSHTWEGSRCVTDECAWSRATASSDIDPLAFQRQITSPGILSRVPEE